MMHTDKTTQLYIKWLNLKHGFHVKTFIDIYLTLNAVILHYEYF